MLEYVDTDRLFHLIELRRVKRNGCLSALLMQVDGPTKIVYQAICPNLLHMYTHTVCHITNLTINQWLPLYNHNKITICDH